MTLVAGALDRQPGPGTDAAGLEAAYRHCWRIATSHYENFTVGSWLLPRRLRRHVAAIYAWARTADDLADEGEVAPAERLARLDTWGAALERSAAGNGRHPIFVAVGDTIRTFELPLEPFRKLLDAFRMDVRFQPFPTFAALREYCRHSADPVGHLVLALFGYRDERRRELADAICTGLQLANFWQDVASDAARGRCYLPEEDLARFGCTAAEVVAGTAGTRGRDLLAFQVERARTHLERGLALAGLVDRRLAREVLLFGWGGLAALDAIAAVDHDVVRRRPELSRRHKSALVVRALLTRTAREREA